MDKKGCTENICVNCEKEEMENAYKCFETKKILDRGRYTVIKSNRDLRGRLTEAAEE